MAFTREQIKQGYAKLSPEAQDFVMSNEITDLTDKILRESGLSEEQVNSADSEILYALYGLQTLDTAVSNIGKLSGKDTTKLKGELQENIFSKYPESGKPGVANDLPMVEPGETAHEVPHVEPAKPPEPSVRKAENPKVAAPTIRDSYPGGTDPYREPLK